MLDEVDKLADFTGAVSAVCVGWPKNMSMLDSVIQAVYHV